MPRPRRRKATFHIDAHEMVGQRLRVDGHFSRTGIQHYTDGTGQTSAEYRAPEEVFSDASLASLRGMPVTVRHPRAVGGQVTPQNWRRLAGRGVVVGTTGEAVTQDGDHTKGSIWVQDQAAIEQVQDQTLTELSVGYTAQLDETPGVTPDGERYDARQINILGNHIALLGGGEARGGPTVRILDAEGHVRFDDVPPREGRTMKQTITVDGLEYEIELPEGTPFATSWAAHTATHADAVKRADQAEAKADGLKSELDTVKVELAQATDPTTVAATVAARSALLADARKVAGSDVADEGDALAIRTGALVARDVDVTDKSPDYIEARFDGLLETPIEDAPKKMRSITDIKDKPVELTADEQALTRLGGRI